MAKLTSLYQRPSLPGTSRSARHVPPARGRGPAYDGLAWPAADLELPQRHPDRPPHRRHIPMLAQMFESLEFRVRHTGYDA